MNAKFLGILCLLIICFSCKNTQEENPQDFVEEKQSEAITESDISKLDFIEFVPSQETEKITENWLEYIQLKEQVSLIKKGDFSYFNDNKEAVD